MKNLAAVTVALLALMGAWTRCAAQDGNIPVRSSAELDQLLGPIALYPDPLIGLILPASTQPSQIVMADRYDAQGGDPSQIEQQPWDPSVQGLAHYPAVLKWMDDNVAWTTQLGQAFTVQQSDVMDSVQRLRTQAQALGNLQSTPQETVVNDSGAVDIEPVNVDEMYVPDYQPELIYTQPGIYCSFGLGLPIGVWLGYDWDWRHHHLITWDHDHPRPGNWWHMAPAERYRHIAAQHSPVWHAAPHAGVAYGGRGDRGYEAVNRNQSVHVETPRSAHPVVGGPAPHPETHAPVVNHAPEPVHEAPVRSVPEINRTREPAPIVTHSAPSESAFGGSQSVREVHESSSRGAVSRGSVGGGGGGGGGGGAARGGNNRR